MKLSSSETLPRDGFRISNNHAISPAALITEIPGVPGSNSQISQSLLYSWTKVYKLKNEKKRHSEEISDGNVEMHGKKGLSPTSL